MENNNKNDGKVEQRTFLSKIPRPNEKVIKDYKNNDNNDNNNKRSGFIFKGKSSYNIHKDTKEETDSKKRDNFGLKRDVVKSQYNIRGDNTATTTTTVTTTTTTKTENNNSGSGIKSIYNSRRRHDNNVNTGLETKAETKNENVEQGIKRRFKFGQGK